jgi:hypothetical protein
MKTLKERIADTSSYLQALTTSDMFPKVQNAVEKKDKNLLVKICRKAKIPEMYSTTVVSVLLSIGPEQKWPPMW